MAADAIATALTVLGPGRGFELAVQKKWAVFFIMRNSNGGFSEKATREFKNLNPQKAY
jgi:thiamine biosynthesis lipoprotein ApbE